MSIDDWVEEMTLTLEEWNRLLVKVLFPEGMQGKSRLYLKEEHFEELSKETGLDREAMIRSLYECTNAKDLAGDLGGKVEEYRMFLMRLPENVLESHPEAFGSPLMTQLMEAEAVSRTPQFLAHLVVAVHAYMSGNRQGKKENEVYPIMADGICKALGCPEDIDAVLEGMRKQWDDATDIEYFSFGPASDDEKKLSPWKYMREWTELKGQIVGDVVTLDTREVRPGRHGKVTVIRYHAPFLKEDISVLEEVGRGLRKESPLEPSSDTILRRVKEVYSHPHSRLSARAKDTMKKAIEEKGEGAAAFVDAVMKGFRSQSDAGRGQGEARAEMADGRGLSALRVQVRTGYYGDLKMSVRIFDAQAKETDGDFTISIDGKDVEIPRDPDDWRLSKPIEVFLKEDGQRIDLSEFEKYRPRRGDRPLILKKEGAFLRRLQRRQTVWDEAEPTSGQMVMVVSNQEWANADITREGLTTSEELRLGGPFSVSGKRVVALKARWPEREMISSGSNFELKGGVKVPRGKDQYLSSAPPVVALSGTRGMEEISILMTIEGEDGVPTRLEAADSAWVIPRFRGRRKVHLEAETEEVVREDDEGQKVKVKQRPWAANLTLDDPMDLFSEFTKDPEPRYETEALRIEDTAERFDEIEWSKHKMMCESRNAAVGKGDPSEMRDGEPFWISHESAMRKASAGRPPVPKPAEPPRKPEGRKPESPHEHKDDERAVAEERSRLMDTTCNVCGTCTRCRRERQMMDNPDDETAWKGYGSAKVSKEKMIELLKEKHDDKVGKPVADSSRDRRRFR